MAPADGARLAVVVEDRRQMARGDPGAVAQGDGALDGGFELADVARPVVLLQDVEGVAGEARHRSCEIRGRSGSERLGQELDVGPPVPKRGEHQADHADAMIELLAKSALLDQGGQVFAGGHDQAGPRRSARMAGACLVVAELQLAEQMELELERQRGDFIEDRACRRGPGPACWTSRASGSSPGAGPVLVRLLHREFVGQRRRLRR